MTIRLGEPHDPIAAHSRSTPSTHVGAIMMPRCLFKNALNEYTLLYQRC